MLFQKTHLYLFALVFASVASTAEDNLESFDQIWSAIEVYQNSSLDDWSYEVHEVTKEHSSRSIYHPVIDGEGKVELLSIDGREPSEKEKIEFYEKHQPRKPNEEDKPDDTFQMVDRKSLKLVSVDENASVYSFTPLMDFDDELKPYDALEGTLIYDERGEFVRSLAMKSVKSFKPDGKVKIKKMNMTFEYVRLADDIIVPATIQMEIAGRAMLVIKIDEAATVTLSNFECSKS